MSKLDGNLAPVSGTCERCGCALGYAASEHEGRWSCCGDCAGSDRCSCGCKASYSRPGACDRFVPTRRMFASRHPEYLRVKEDHQDRARAFPFSDRRRGR